MITNLQRARESIAAQVNDERRMREELQSLQQQVIRQERLAAIGVLVSGVAHELNNPLQAILGFAELLQMQKDMPEQARADLTLIQKESARASAIIRNLSRFGRQMSEPSPVRLRDVVASVMELRQRKLEELNIAVEIDEQSQGAGDGDLHRAAAGGAELRDQRRAGDRARRTRRSGSIIDPHRRSRRLGVDRSRGLPVPACRPSTKPSCSSRSTRPSRSAKAPALGLSVSYDIIRSHNGRIGYRRGAIGRRDLLLRAADRAATTNCRNDTTHLLHRTLSPDVRRHGR